MTTILNADQLHANPDLEHAVLQILERGMFTTRIIANQLDTAIDTIDAICQRLHDQHHCTRTLDGMWCGL